jgi:type IV pilus assembly protein PilE
MQRNNRTDKGFSLIELMVVVVIISILVAIAVPMYTSQVQQSRRTDARTALLDLASREERYFSTNPTGYTTTPASLGYTAFPQTVGSGYYTITVACTALSGAALGCDGNANAPTGPSFYLTANVVTTTPQGKDTNCYTFAVDSTGRQFAFNSGGADTTTYCWSN